jgi:hypothetical protein
MPGKTLNRRDTASCAAQRHGGLRFASTRQRSAPAGTGLPRSRRSRAGNGGTGGGRGRPASGISTRHRPVGILAFEVSEPGGAAGTRGTPAHPTAPGIRAGRPGNPLRPSRHDEAPRTAEDRRRTGITGRGIFMARILAPPPARHAHGRGIVITLFPCSGSPARAFGPSPFVRPI